MDRGTSSSPITEAWEPTLAGTNRSSGDTVTSLERLLKEEYLRDNPVHGSDLIALLNGVCRFDEEHKDQSHTYRLFEEPEYGGIPKSTAHKLISVLREQGQYSVYHHIARRAGFWYHVPRAKRLIYARRLDQAERWAPEPDPKDAYFDAAGVEHW